MCIETSREAEEAVGAVLEEAFGQPPVSLLLAEGAGAKLSVFVERKSEAGPTVLETLRYRLERIRACGLDTAPGRIELRAVARENWAESWKKHFKPFVVGRRLLVKPDWSPRRPRAGQEVVVLNPGLSFGTGQHPTTRFCLEEVVAHRPRATAKGSSKTSVALLDIGTGSGILAIAAARLGYQPVVAFDADAEAVRTARTNARRNGVERKVSLFCADLRQKSSELQRRFDVVCANLTSDLLLSEADRILEWVRPGGVLVLAGIMANEFGDVRRKYALLGVELERLACDQGWASATFSVAYQEVVDR